MKSKKPVVILVGGHSLRMGMPKHLLEYQGKPAWKRMVECAEKFSDHVSISCRSDQLDDFKSVSMIEDRYDDIGPMGGILSSFEALNAEQIVFLSCDVPLLEENSIKALLEAIDQSKLANCLMGRHSDLPEPILACWNKRAIPILKAAVQSKSYSIMKCLKTHGYKSIIVSDEELTNVNTKEDYERIRAQLIIQ